MPRCLVASLAVLALVGCSHGSTVAPAPSDPLGPTPVGSAPSTSEHVATSTAQPVQPTVQPTVTTLAPWVGPCGRTDQAAHGYDHVVWIWMENKNENKVLDAGAAPYFASVAASCGAASNYVDHGIHPSLPSYLAATSGSPQGVADDDGPAAHPLDVDNLFRQVRAVGKAAKSYQEAMPENCALQSSGRYAVKHNPAAYYIGGDDRAACRRDDVGFDQFMSDLQSGLPAFALITPDTCHDMHDCPVATGDEWLAQVLPAITGSPTYREGRTAVFIVFDESQGGGSMPFFAVAPWVVPGTRSDAQLDHYALLAFTEDALGIPTRLGSAAGAPSLADAFGL